MFLDSKYQRSLAAKAETWQRLGIPPEGLTAAQRLVAIADGVRHISNENARLAHQLRFARQRIVELESRNDSSECLTGAVGVIPPLAGAGFFER